jgi:hypothetical protein
MGNEPSLSSVDPKQIAKQIGNQLSSALTKTFDDAISPLIDEVNEFGETIENSFESVTRKIENGFSSVKDAVKDQITSVGEDIVGEVTSFAYEVKDATSNALDSTMNAFTQFGGLMSFGFSELQTQVKQGANILDDNMKKYAHDLARYLSIPFYAIEDKIMAFVDFVLKLGTFLMTFFNFIRDFFAYIGGVFVCVGFFVEKFFSTCILYYILRLVLIIIYGVLAFFFWIFGLGWLEDLMFDMLVFLNTLIFNITKAVGEPIDIIQDFYPAECYDCGFSFNDIPPFPKFDVSGLFGSLKKTIF